MQNKYTKYSDSLDRATKEEWALFLKENGYPYVEPTEADLIALGIEKRRGGPASYVADQGSNFDKYGNKKITDPVMSPDDSEFAMSTSDYSNPEYQNYVDKSYDDLMASEIARVSESDFDSNLANPLIDPTDLNREDARSARLLADYQKPTKVDIPDYPRGNPSYMDDMTVAQDITKPPNMMMPEQLNPSMAVSPHSQQFNPMTGKTEPNQMMPTGEDYESVLANTESMTPMTDNAKSWYDSLKSSFTSDTDAYSDPLLLGGMAINSTDQSPVFPGTSMKGSGTGIMKGAMTGAGLGAKTGNPKGALIGAGIGAVMGLLGNFDSKSQSYTPPPTISRGSGIPFPQNNSMQYYEGLI